MKQPNTSSLPTASVGVILRSAILFSCQFVTTLALAPLVLFNKGAAFSSHYRIAKLWVRINQWVLEHVCGLRYDVQGIENIPERNGVILSKHQSTWETFSFLLIFPPMVYLLKQELLQIPVWGWALARLDPIAIDRDAKTAALKKVLREGEERLKSGRWVVVFPEGTRVPPGERGKYNTSGAMLAHRAHCPVVFVAHNAGEFWRRHAFLKFPGKIQVRISPPIDASQFSANEINRQAEEWIEAQMLEITGTGKP